MSTNPVVISKWNWEGFSNTIHSWFMMKLGFAPSSNVELLFLATEFAGEAGELCDAIKKYVRDGISDKVVDGLRGEIADVRIMLHHIEKAFGIDGEIAAAEKVAFNYRRPGWTEIPFKPGGPYSTLDLDYNRLH